MIKGCKLNIHVNVIFKHDYFVIKLNFLLKTDINEQK